MSSSWWTVSGMGGRSQGPSLPSFLTSLLWPLKAAAEMEGHLGEAGGATLSPTVALLLEGLTPPLLCGAHSSRSLPEPLPLTGSVPLHVQIPERDLMTMSWNQTKNSSSNRRQPGTPGS